MNIKDIRRENMRYLVNVAGSITEMAKRVEKSPSQISQLIGKKKSGSKNKPIGDMIAAQVEAAFNKPRGWLDKEHFHTAEAGAKYGFIPTAQYVPVIAWDEISEWRKNQSQQMSPTERKTYEHWVPVASLIGKDSFALHVNSDSMEAPSGISFPNGGIIVIDPERAADNGSFVIVNMKENGQDSLTFKQLMIDGSRRYLKPLNPRYSIIELSQTAVVYGVVKLLLMEFD